MEYRITNKSNFSVTVKKSLTYFYLLPCDFEKKVYIGAEKKDRTYKKMTIINFDFWYWSYKITIIKY